MITCKVCKSKMPDELFISAFINGMYTKNTCPICTMTLINIEHGINVFTKPRGEIAAQLVEEAYQYYKPVGDNIYGFAE